MGFNVVEKSNDVTTFRPAPVSHRFQDATVLEEEWPKAWIGWWIH